MEFIKKILSTIYSSENGMLYFYIITSILALFLIVLIIIAIKKDKSNLKIKVNPNIISYKNIGENNQKIECETQIGFNLLRDEVEGSTYEFSTLDSEVATVA